MKFALYLYVRLLVLPFLASAAVKPTQALTHTTQQQPTDSARFDSILTPLFAGKGPGATVLIAEEGKVLYRKAFGQASLELAVAMQPEHVFRLGSITKQFTACAILKLAEQGKLSLQDSITKFIPDYPTHGYRITIEQLLTHTAGIRNLTGMKTWTLEARKKDLSPKEVVDYFKHEPLDFVPGKEFRYSNSGYILLGYIIELVSGKRYEEYLREYFFQPLAMPHSVYDHSTAVLTNRVAGYQRTEDGYENAAFMSMTQPFAAGGLLSTVDDLYRWYEGLFQGKVLSKESLQKAFSPYILANGKPSAYGYGWRLGNIQGSPTLKHGGLINGFATFVLYLPQEKLLVAILTNCEANTDLETPASKLAAIALHKPYQWNQVKLLEKELQSYEGVYASQEGQRYITFEEGSLLYFTRGGIKSELLAFGKKQFFLPNTLTILEFVTNAQGKITGFLSKNTEAPLTWNRTQEAIAKKTPIKVGVKSLEEYIGRYQFSPSFILSIYKQGDCLYGKATGKGQVPQKILPYAKDKFFAQHLDATLQFNRDAKGTLTGLTLFQQGEKYAQKID